MSCQALLLVATPAVKSNRHLIRCDTRTVALLLFLILQSSVHLQVLSPWTSERSDNMTVNGRTSAVVHLLLSPLSGQ